ncbi:hypothetical protein BWQ96_10013 [Gracilariopsis chorda]|uniref:Uncharacterized protein n=1 Tax=Gracilariopsis chorda TaxID=448386 RepID=A0A2V3IGK8_9FLOR|nr:hypothetical protein BWQ96_10013 [Gracilariopsis chorda]|eukprot:PXF40280.1 hypothetical protein BWQ96_10013 [Gracilariopsis chorda]
MKTFSAVVCAIIGFAAAVPATTAPSTTTAATTTAASVPVPDVTAFLGSGTGGVATGNNAVVTAADQTSGAAASKTDSSGLAFASAAPGQAGGIAVSGPTPAM